MDAGRLMPSTRVAGWNGKTNKLDGSSAANAAPSALAIKQLTGAQNDGLYWIDLPTVGPKQIYCIMDSAYDGGGWMMTMRATTGSTFTYSANYWTTANTLNSNNPNLDNADAKFDTFNYASGTDFLAIFPDITNGGSLPSTTRGWTWLQKNVSASTTMLSLFSGPQVYISAPSAFSGFGSAWSAQGGTVWYGFNYTLNGNNNVRWGFGWNNESNDHTSNDVTGGIGVQKPNYSAGDAIYCCQTQTGINRSARVEMYIR
jgi:hypothetical protein